MRRLQRLKPPAPGFTQLGIYLVVLTALTALTYVVWHAAYHDFDETTSSLPAML